MKDEKMVDRTCCDPWIFEKSAAKPASYWLASACSPTGSPIFANNEEVMLGREKASQKWYRRAHCVGRPENTKRICLDHLEESSRAVTTSVSKTSSDMKLMLYERKNQLSDPQSNHLCAISLDCIKNSAVLVLFAT